MVCLLYVVPAMFVVQSVRILTAQTKDTRTYSASKFLGSFQFIRFVPTCVTTLIIVVIRDTFRCFVFLPRHVGASD